MASATKARARITSRCVTPVAQGISEPHAISNAERCKNAPKRRRASYTPACLNTSAAMGTVEFTGLEIMFTIARGHALLIACGAIPSDKGAPHVGRCQSRALHTSLTMPALMLNRSSRCCGSSVRGAQWRARTRVAHRHAGLARHASRDDDHVTPRESVHQLRSSGEGAHLRGPSLSYECRRGPSAGAGAPWRQC
jgi:hypothetical protein